MKGKFLPANDTFQHHLEWVVEVHKETSETKMAENYGNHVCEEI